MSFSPFYGTAFAWILFRSGERPLAVNAAGVPVYTFRTLRVAGICWRKADHWLPLSVRRRVQFRLMVHTNLCTRDPG
jgi:hypothetical protein